jgi:hypothetical protein
VNWYGVGRHREQESEKMMSLDKVPKTDQGLTQMSFREEPKRRMGRFSARRSLYALLLLSAVSANAAVTPEMQQAIRAATFEVVLKKPEHDPLTYEKPLPLDLLPFVERNDAYRSIGTAFALGHNTYVTAAHVFGAGVDINSDRPRCGAPTTKFIRSTGS